MRSMYLLREYLFIDEMISTDHSSSDDKLDYVFLSKYLSVWHKLRNIKSFYKQAIFCGVIRLTEFFKSFSFHLALF